MGWTQGGSCYFEFSNSHFQGTQWNVTALSCLFSKWTPQASLTPSALPQIASGWVQPHFIVKPQSVCLTCTEPQFSQHFRSWLFLCRYFYLAPRGYQVLGEAMGQLFFFFYLQKLELGPCDSAEMVLPVVDHFTPGLS